MVGVQLLADAARVNSFSVAKLRFSLAVLLLCSLLAVWGCEKETVHGPDELVVGIATEPQNLDPRYGLDAGSLRCYQLMYNGLFRLDDQSNPKPDLAESFRMENSTEYVIDLRRGVLFHDGGELTADDVRSTFESILDERNASPLRNNFAVIREIRVENPYRVRFILRQPYAPFLNDLTQPIIELPSKKNESGRPAPPPGTGPFRFERRQAGQYIDFAAHHAYFRGEPRLKRVRLRITTDDTTRFLQLKKGEIDFVENNIMPEAVPLLEKDDRLTVMKGEGSNYAYLGFNLRDPILSKRRVRAAIAHGLNIDEMMTYLVGGYARRASGLLYPGSWAYEPDVEHYDYDLELAARLLDEAGFTNRPVRFRLSYKTSQNDVALRKAQYVHAQLKKLNIDVEIRSYEWSTFFADIRRGDFQLYSLEWVSITDPDIYYYLFHSKSVPPDGANRGGYSNPEVDRLLELGRRETDRSKRAEIYHRVQKIVAHDLPYISLWHPDNIAIFKRGLTGFHLHPTGAVYLQNVGWSRK
jgi:peptide/nickel transport system substrate-binding protein